tara:strand:- start:41 stop:541 length:501 start_codon:yes stop_codon:yes gene_type:complete
MVNVKLESWEYEWALHVGARRYIENWSKTDARHYDRNRMEDDRTASAAACVAELAVAKLTNQYWGGHVWPGNRHETYKDMADVGHNIEVRRVRTSNNAAVRRRQLDKGLVLFVVRPIPPEFRTADVLGWIDHDEAWEKGEPSKYAPENTRVIAEDYLNPPIEYGQQ